MLLALAFLLLPTLWAQMVAYAVVASNLAAVAAVPSILRGRADEPMHALAWIFAVFSLPIVGLVGWVLVGRNQLRALASLGELEGGIRTGPDRDDAPERLLACLPPGTPVIVAPSAYVLYDEGEKAFDALEEAFKAARHSIFVELYLWEPDKTGARMRDLLVRRANEGIRVRILVDGAGSFGFLRRFGRPLREAGAEIHPFLANNWLPTAKNFHFGNHRKVVVVDERVAFMGGMNFGDDYCYDFYDLLMQIRGPAVRGLACLFADDWHHASGTALPLAHPEPAPVDGPVTGACALLASGPNRADELLSDTWFLAFRQARARIWIASPYLLPPPALLASLRAASQRGVDVRLLVPGKSDHFLPQLASRMALRDLARAGMTLIKYGPNKMSHAKAILIDDDLAAVGSPNLDPRSLRNNFEIAVLVEGRSMNKALEGAFLRACKDGEEVAEMRDPTLAAAVAHLLSPLM